MNNKISYFLAIFGRIVYNVNSYVNERGVFMDNKEYEENIKAIKENFKLMEEYDETLKKIIKIEKVMSKKEE